MEANKRAEEIKIGDRVKISPTSEYYQYESDRNPRYLTGEVIKLDNNEEENYGLPICVRWSNGKENEYAESDLTIIAAASATDTGEQGEGVYTRKDMIDFAQNMISQYKFGNKNIEQRALLEASLSTPSAKEKVVKEQEAGEWISVENRMPPIAIKGWNYSKDCIVKTLTGMECLAYYHHLDLVWYQEQKEKPYPIVHGVTHWQPISKQEVK